MGKNKLRCVTRFMKNYTKVNKSKSVRPTSDGKQKFIAAHKTRYRKIPGKPQQTSRAIRQPTLLLHQFNYLTTSTTVKSQQIMQQHSYYSAFSHNVGKTGRTLPLL